MFGIGSIFAGLAGKALAVLAVLAALGGAYAWITTGAFNRGYAKSQADMAAVIRKQAEAVKRDAERLRALPPEKLDEELRALCRRHGGGAACDPPKEAPK